MVNWINGAFPVTPNTEPDRTKREMFDYVSNLLKKKETDSPVQWPWCICNPTDKYCRIPQSYRQVDVSVLYESAMTKGTGHVKWTFSTFLGEVHGSKLSDSTSAIMQEAAHSLIFLPKVYGIVVYKEYVSLMEFRRDPEASCIQVYSVDYLMNGNQNSAGKIGIDVAYIMREILKCIVYGLLSDLPSTVNHFHELLEAGYKPDGPTPPDTGDGKPQSICKCCWHFKDYYDIKYRLDHPTEWPMYHHQLQAADQIPEEGEDN